MKVIELKNLKLRAVILLLSLLVLYTYAIDISITGIVKNSGDVPVQGAKVQLMKMMFSTTTATDGTFGINTTSIDESIKKIIVDSKPFVKNGILSFSVDNKMKSASIEIYNLKGSLIKRMLFNNLSVGNNSLQIFDINHSNGIYIVRLVIGNHKYIMKAILSKKKFRSYYKVNENNIKEFTKGISKSLVEVVDTLRVSADGYSTQKVPVSMHDTSLSITLLSASSDPYVEFEDIYLAIDTMKSDSAINQYNEFCDTVPVLNRGDTLLLNIRLRNSGSSNAFSVECSLSTNDTFVTVVKPVSGYNNIGSFQDALNYSWYKIIVTKSIPSSHNVEFKLFIKDSWGSSWTDACYFIPNPLVINEQNIDDDETPDSDGNGDGIVNENEIIEYTPRLCNASPYNITSVYAMLISPSNNLIVKESDDFWPFGDFSEGTQGLPEWDYVFNVGAELSGNECLDLLIYGKIDNIWRRWILPVILPQKPVITSHPESQSVLLGQTTTFTITAVGKNLLYQWQKNSVNISGATSSSYNIPAAPWADNGALFRCIVRNVAGNDTSDNAVLTVNSIITSHPESKSVGSGQTVTFTISAVGENLSYQWQKNSVNISGATSSSYTTPTVTLSDNGALFRCIVSNTSGADTSNIALLKVIHMTEKMVLVNAKDKSFEMGSNSGEADEKPVHTVSFTFDFWMDTTEVTQGNYSSIMSSTYSGYSDPDWSDLGTGDNYPVYRVNWYDAVLYCNALSKFFTLDTVYSYSSINGIPGNGCVLNELTIDLIKNGYRLPTEAEWEYACRAGTTTDYYWGEGDIGDYTWNAVNSGNKSHPVTKKLPNSYGLYDMSGNVYEMCNDWYGSDYYSSSPSIDPKGPTEGARRVFRGGYWGQFGYDLASANRRYVEPNNVGNIIGFRVCLIDK